MTLNGYIAFILKYRWPVIAIATVIMLAAAIGTRFIGVTNDYRSLFDEDNSQLVALNAFEDIYGASNTVLIAVAPGEGSVFTREALGVIDYLTDAAWQIPHNTRVDSLTNYSHSEGREDELIVEPLVGDAGTLDNDDLMRIRSIALGAPSIVGRLVSPDGTVGGVLISFILPDDPDAAVVEITNRLDSVLDEVRADHPDISLHMTGTVPLNRAFADATKDDLKSRAPLVFLVIVLTATALLRSAIGTLAIVAILGFVINTTVGFSGWLGTVFNPASSGVPIIVMTVAVAHSVHIVSSALLAMGRGMDRNAAIAESIRINAWPVFLTSLTTVIGFLSLNSSDSPPFRILGNLVAFGVACAFVYSMTFLPALMSLLPLRGRQSHSQRREFFDRFGVFVATNRKLLLWCSAILAVALIGGISRIDLTDNWTRYLSERYEFRRDTDFVINNLTGIEILEYSLNAGHEGGITDPDYLHRIEAFAEWFRQQPEVRHVQAFSDIMKRLNRNLHGDDPAFHRIPDDPELSAQYLILYELSLPFGADLNNRMDVSKSATRMTVTLQSLTSEQQRSLDARAQNWISENSPGLSDGGTGVTIVFAHLSQRNIRSMLVGTIVAMTLISLILIFVFRSLRMGLISLLPNFVPAALAFGLWGYLVGRVGLAGSVATAVGFGIVVDDTIHFLSHYLRSRREGLDGPEAVRGTFRTVGHAMLTTTAILCLGFLVFATSGFEVSWSLGLLVTTTLFFALLADFLLLPPLLLTLDRRTAKD